MIAEVPTMAIEFVYMKSNTCVIHDEMLSHRLGLVPLDSRNVDKYNWRTECDCDNYCNNCSVKFDLKVKCIEDENLEVTSMNLSGDQN